MKYCAKCGENIEENNKDEKWSMIVTKRGNKIIEFECFHLECWKRFFEDAVGIAIRERIKNTDLGIKIGGKV